MFCRRGSGILNWRLFELVSGKSYRGVRWSWCFDLGLV
jgi:hypothetical protein